MADNENDETEATPPEADPEVSEQADPAAPTEETPEEAPAEEQAPEEQAAEEATESSADPAAPAQEPAAGSDVKPESPAAPGAELEPIAIEAEQELTAEERARREAEAEERARREAEATEDAREEPARRGGAVAEVPGDLRVQATGKRKSSVARVMLTAGSGTIQVNRTELERYFPRSHHQTMARQPLVTAGYEKAVDVTIRVHGGGISGQAGAIRHGIARALTEIDSELRRELKRRGLLTRDDRRKERRKAGLKKARKKPQFSKR